MINLIKEKTITLAVQKRSLYVLGFFVLCSILFYIYFANEAVRTLTILEKSKQEIQSLSMEVSEMESEHISLDNNISIARAKSLGFVEVNGQTFITGKSKGGLSLNKN